MLAVEEMNGFFCLFCASLHTFAPFNVCKSEKLQETVGALVLERHTVFHGLQRFASCLAFVDDRLK